jgi:hypothetical protein
MNSQLKILKEVKESDLFIEHETKKFMPIMKRQQLDTSIYKFSILTQNVENEKNSCPIFIYGTTLSLLKDGDNRKAFINAIKNGVHFRFALIDPNQYPEYENQKKVIKDSSDSIALILQIIEDDLPKKITKESEIGSIDLRLTSCITKNSFSSFVFKNRRVSTLDFNFNKEEGVNIKYSQIFDENFSTKDSQEKIGCLSSELNEEYINLFNKSTPAVMYPIIKLRVIVCTLFADKNENKIIFIKKISSSNSKHSKNISEYSFPSIDINCNNDISSTVKEKIKTIIGYNTQYIETIPVHETINKRQKTLFFIVRSIGEQSKNFGGEISLFDCCSEATCSILKEYIGPKGIQDLKYICNKY